MPAISLKAAHIFPWASGQVLTTEIFDKLELHPQHCLDDGRSGVNAIGYYGLDEYWITDSTGIHHQLEYSGPTSAIAPECLLAEEVDWEKLRAGTYFDKGYFVIVRNVDEQSPAAMYFGIKARLNRSRFGSLIQMPKVWIISSTMFTYSKI